MHGYLYMLEHETSWVLDDGLYEPVPLVRSPWSQRLLPVRPYLQACFVWFAITHFWLGALAARNTGPEAERRLDRARNGFLRADLRSHLGGHVAGVDGRLLDTISTLQEAISADPR